MSGWGVEAGFENDRLFRDALGNPTRMIATAHALAGTDQASRSIALGRAIDEIGHSPENYRLYFPGDGARNSDLELEGKRPGSGSRGRAHPAGIELQSAGYFARRRERPHAADAGRWKGLADAKGIGPWDPDLLYQPATNIKLGTAHLSGLARRYPEVVKVLAAYNAGESRVEKWSSKAGAPIRRYSRSASPSSRRATTCARSCAIVPTTRRSIPGRGSPPYPSRPARPSGACASR